MVDSTHVTSAKTADFHFWYTALTTEFKKRSFVQIAQGAVSVVREHADTLSLSWCQYTLFKHATSCSVCFLFHARVSWALQPALAAQASKNKILLKFDCDTLLVGPWEQANYVHVSMYMYSCVWKKSSRTYSFLFVLVLNCNANVHLQCI